MLEIRFVFTTVVVSVASIRLTLHLHLVCTSVTLVLLHRPIQRGTTVSGGQKARIGFARLLYQQQAINILDDPYSAVDPDVALDMHRRGFEGTLAGTTRVLVVSARLELLATATVVIRLGTDGDVEAYGPPSEVLHGYVVPNNGRKPQGEVLESSAGGIDAETVIDSTDAEEKEADAAGRFLTTAEDRAAGTVAKHIYSTYFSCEYHSTDLCTASMTIPAVLKCSTLSPQMPLLGVVVL